MTAAETYARALADLKDRMHVAPAAVSPEETVALVQACMRVARPFAEVDADAAGYPVRVAAGVWFWKLTVGASIWLDRADALLGGRRFDPRYRLALVYACRYARVPGMFPVCASARELGRVVKDGLRDLRATAEEVDAALEKVLGLRPRGAKAQAETERAAVSWAKLAARLETQTGIPASEWIWQRSGAYLVKAYNDLHEFARACGPMGGDTAHMLDELDEAVNALQLLKVKIMRRVNGHG